VSRWSSSIRTTRLVVDAVRASGLPERLVARRPRDLPGFLAALQATGPDQVLASPEMRRDAMVHLGHRWSTSVAAIARPDSLPEVVRRRTRLRVHPVAPWATAGAAAGGSALVVAGAAPVWLEGLGVLVVAALTAVVSRIAWRPRPSHRDRRFALAGTPALAARADALLALGSPTADAREQEEVDRRLAVLHGAARAAESVEKAAAEAGLLTGTDLGATPGLPAHQRLAEELVLARARLVHDVLSLQETMRRLDARQRFLEQQEYTRIVDGLHPGLHPDAAPGDL
jgi:hypothetical protein